MLDKLNNHRLNAIVSDLYYTYNGSTPVNYNNYSASALTTSSYLKLEAEYSSYNDLDGGGDDSYWYCTHNEHNGNMPRVGHPDDDGQYQAWVCTQSFTNPGFAYTDIRWRWFNSDPAVNSYKRFGDEFRIYNEHDTLSLANKYLYVRYRLRLGSFPTSLSPSTPLLSFTTMGYRGAGTADSVNVSHNFVDYNSNLLYAHTTDYYYGDYLLAGSPTGYYDIELKISYADMISAGLMSATGYWKYLLVNLNPRVYWHGNCDLYLDYIEIEDQMHYDMIHSVAAYTDNINKRIDYLQALHTSDVIKFVYSLDEPMLGQFHSYQRVQSYIENDPHYDSRPNPNIITAAYDTHYDKIQKAGNNDEGYQFYDHVKCFRDNANPNSILPDMYPVKPNVLFNVADSGVSNAFQTLIDNKVLRQYKTSKQYSVRTTPHKPFFPIVQAFGEWMGTDWMSWALPPYETQKCLKYLPLCYGADGIIDYRAVNTLNGMIGSNPAGQYCSILKDDSGLLGTNFTRNAISDSNKKIGVLGQIIKHSLNWKDAGRLNVGDEPSNLISSTSLPAMGISSLQVMNPHDGLYSGYVQCGFYDSKDDADDPYFMLVNRRSNYSRTDDGFNTETCPPKCL